MPVSSLSHHLRTSCVARSLYRKSLLKKEARENMVRLEWKYSARLRSPAPSSPPGRSCPLHVIQSSGARGWSALQPCAASAAARCSGVSSLACQSKSATLW